MPPRHPSPAILGLVALLGAACVAAARDELPPAGPLARAFGASANFGAELSPDGTRVSFIRANEDGSTFLEVVALASGSSRVVLESPEDRQGLRWCRWANDTRLICAAEPLPQPLGPGNTMSLIAIDADGKNPKVLYRNVSGPGRTFDRIIDWLPGTRRS